MKTIAQQIKWDFEANDDLVIRDKNGKSIYWENSNRFWVKAEYDSQGNEIYYEVSDGKIIDKRPKTCEGEEIIIKGVKYKLTKV